MSNIFQFIFKFFLLARAKQLGIVLGQWKSKQKISTRKHWANWEVDPSLTRSVRLPVGMVLCPVTPARNEEDRLK